MSDTPMLSFDALIGCLEEMENLPDDWDGQGARQPSIAAFGNAYLVIPLACAAGRLPDRVTPDVMGGVALYWFSAKKTDGGASRKYAWMSCDNDGSLCLLLSDRDSSFCQARDVPAGLGIVDAIREAHSFVSAAA